MINIDYTDPVRAQFAAMAAYTSPLALQGQSAAPSAERSVESVSGASADTNGHHPKQGSGQGSGHAGSGSQDRRDTFQRSSARGEPTLVFQVLSTKNPSAIPDGVGRTLDVYG